MLTFDGAAFGRCAATTGGGISRACRSRELSKMMREMAAAFFHLLVLRERHREKHCHAISYRTALPAGTRRIVIGKSFRHHEKRKRKCIICLYRLASYLH